MITLVIGSDAVGSDGFRGEVLAVVVEPAARTVTHLAVEPEGRQGLARLVASSEPAYLRVASRSVETTVSPALIGVSYASDALGHVTLRIRPSSRLVEKYPPIDAANHSSAMIS